MTYSVIRTSAYLLQILSQPSVDGFVHSVYRRTINLSVEGCLLALQTVGSPLSPVSLITELTEAELEQLIISPGDPVRFSSQKLCISGHGSSYSFHYHEACIVDLCLTEVLSSSARKRLSSHIQTVLSQTDTSGLAMLFDQKFYSDIPLLFLAAGERISCCTALYGHQKYEEAARELARLIGLGIGLTPSGDDFLCGVLAGLFLTGRSDTAFAQSLRDTIQQHLTDTIDISATFLSCALDRQFSLAVKGLETVAEVSDIRKSFLEIGHSSGMDTLCGVLYALQLGTG